MSNGTVANDVCDAARQLTMLKQSAPGLSASSDYTYDAVGNRTSQQRSDGTTETYGYDATDQLTGANFDNQAIGLKDHNVTYTYDPSGNRIDATDNGDATAYASNPLNQYTAVAGDPLNYDTNGNLASQKGWTYTYDAQNRIINAQRGSIQMSFAYDGLDRCIKRTFNGTATYFCYAGWNLIEEHSGNSTLLASYVHGPNTDEILSKTDIIGAVYYHQDALGNLTHLTDTNGNVVEQYRYDAFGKPTFLDAQNNVLANSAYGNRFLFTGREWLQDIALYDYRNRIYSVELGRFLQTDPILFAAGDANIYRYVSNNPVNASDPDGLLFREAVTFGIGYAKHFEFMIRQKMGEEVDDYDFHRQTSKTMAKYGDPFLTRMLGEAKEFMYPGADSDMDRQANQQGISEGLAEKPFWSRCPY